MTHLHGEPGTGSSGEDRGDLAFDGDGGDGATADAVSRPGRITRPDRLVEAVDPTTAQVNGLNHGIGTSSTFALRGATPSNRTMGIQLQERPFRNQPDTSRFRVRVGGRELPLRVAPDGMVVGTVWFDRVSPEKTVLIEVDAESAETTFLWRPAIVTPPERPLIDVHVTHDDGAPPTRVTDTEIECASGDRVHVEVEPAGIVDMFIAWSGCDEGRGFAITESGEELPLAFAATISERSRIDNCSVYAVSDTGVLREPVIARSFDFECTPGSLITRPNVRASSVAALRRTAIEQGAIAIALD